MPTEFFTIESDADLDALLPCVDEESSPVERMLAGQCVGRDIAECSRDMYAGIKTGAPGAADVLRALNKGNKARAARK